VIIIVGMIAVVFLMMTVVIPKLTEMYKDFGVSLPFVTQLLVDVSNFFVRFWWLMILGGIGTFVGFSRWKKTKLGELTLDTIMLKIPIIGQLQKKVLLAEFSRTLGMLITAGIHILDGLAFLRESMGNVLFRNALTEISQKIEKGFPMGESFAQYEVFPVIVSQMIRVGEETGKLDETMTKLSNYFEKESEYLVKNLTTAIEPIIMVLLGLGVGFIVFAIITPIYSLTNQIK
jgi:type II secretory pathway component PulF